MTYTTNTSAAHAAALAMRDAAAALARRRPLYDGASGEPADEELAQAIEDLPLQDADPTDWKAEAERLRGVLRSERDRGEKYLAERNRASRLFHSVTTTHARLAAWARDELGGDVLARFFGVLANGAPDWKTSPRNLAVDLLAVTAERDAALAELAQARDELREQVDFVEQHLAVISGVLGSPEPIEIDDIAARLHLLIAERDELAARLAEIAAQEPVAWIERITGRLADPTDPDEATSPGV